MRKTIGYLEEINPKIMSSQRWNNSFDLNSLIRHKKELIKIMSSLGWLRKEYKILKITVEVVK